MSTALVSNTALYELACASRTFTVAAWRTLARGLDRDADAAPTLGQRTKLRDRADDCRRRADRLELQAVPA